MFKLGNYKVRFQHTNRDFLILKGKELKSICGATTCRILDNETNEVKIGATIICENGNNNSKNNRRKQTLAACLQELFPSNVDTLHRAELNKKARTLFWQEYAEKRGGLEDQLSKKEEQENVIS